MGGRVKVGRWLYGVDRPAGGWREVGGCRSG